MRLEGRIRGVGSLLGRDPYFTCAPAEFVRDAKGNIGDCYGGRISIPTDSFMSAIAELTEVKIRACPLCGAVERKVLERREPWEIVECAACGTALIGSEPAYEVQARISTGTMRTRRKRSGASASSHFRFMSRASKPLAAGYERVDAVADAALGPWWEVGDFGCGDADLVAGKAIRG